VLAYNAEIEDGGDEFQLLGPIRLDAIEHDSASEHQQQPTAATARTDANVAYYYAAASGAGIPAVTELMGREQSPFFQAGAPECINIINITHLAAPTTVKVDRLRNQMPLELQRSIQDTRTTVPLHSGDGVCWPTVHRGGGSWRRISGRAGHGHAGSSG
jgi:hypothetical protein